MTAFLLLVGIVTGACALVVLADYFAPDDLFSELFESNYLAPWENREDES